MFRRDTRNTRDTNCHLFSVLYHVSHVSLLLRGIQREVRGVVHTHTFMGSIGTRGDTRNTWYTVDIAGFQAGHIGGTAGTRAAHGSNPKRAICKFVMRITPRRQAGEAYTGFFGFCVIAPDTEVVKVPASNRRQARQI